MRSRRTGVVCFLLAAAAIAGAADLPVRPDLDVTFVERLPRYPAYEVRINDGLPEIVQPGGDEVLPPEAWDAVQRDPKPGDEVTFVAHIVNHGPRPSGPFTFAWQIDGEEVETGRCESLGGPARASGSGVWEIAGEKLKEAALRPGTFTNLTLSWSWRPGPHTVEIAVAPEGDVEEIATENNRREERTDALALAFVVRERLYNAFTEVPGPLGSASFEDWAQHHVQLLRSRFRGSVYESAPEGVIEEMRVDLIKVLDDNETRGLDTRGARAAGFDALMVLGNELYAARDAAVSHPALLVRLQRELGLVDPADLALSARANSVLTEDGELVAIGHTNAAWEPLRSDVEALLDEHSVLALNRCRGMRRGYTGAYFYDVPSRNVLRLLDAGGAPAAEARVTAYRRQGNAIPDRIFFAGQADADGRVEIPNTAAPIHRTAVGPQLRPNPFGIIDLSGRNGLLLLKVEARGQIEWHWLEIADFNLAFWRGNASNAVYPLRTSVPALGAPEPPTDLTAEGTPAGRATRVWLRWQPVDPPPARYAIVRGWSDDYIFEPVAEVAGTSLAFGEEFPRGMPRPIARYRVAAVDAEGRSSAQTRPTAAAPLRDAAGLAVLPGGRLVACDRESPAPLLLNPRGEAVRAFVEESARLFATDAATGPDGTVAILDMPDASNAFRRVGFVLTDRDGVILDSFATSAGEQPDDLSDPKGIAVDDLGRIYVVDTGNHRVQVFGSGGVLVGSFGELGSGGDQLLWPEDVALYQGEIAVADTGNRRVVFYEEQAPGDYRQSSEIGGFAAPCSVVYDAEGTLHVCDRDAGRILAYDTDDRLLGAYVGDEDNGPFGQPVCAAFPSADVIAVADRAEGRVRVIAIDRLRAAETR